jgi:PAS domain S-box-containing protein
MEGRGVDGEGKDLITAEPEPLEEPATAPGCDVLGDTLDAMLEGVQVIGPDWRYLYLNHTAAAHGQRERSALIGRTMMECYPGIDATPMFATLRRCMDERQPARIENHFIYPNGDSGWFDLSITPVPLGIVVLSIDISERKRLDEALRRSQEELAVTLDRIPDAVIATHEDGTLSRMNQAAETLTGWRLDDIKGRPLHEVITFLAQATGEPTEDPVHAILRDGLMRDLTNGTLLVTRDGRRFPVSSTGASLRDAEGNLRGAVLVLRNLADEYSLQRQLQQAQRMEAIGQLAGGIAHDFNNLLSVIFSFGGLALEEIGPEHRAAADLREMLKSAELAQSLTGQLLAFSRRKPIAPKTLNLNEVINGVHRMLDRLVTEDIELETNLATDLGNVLVDASAVEQVLMNLVVNARDAMPNGGHLVIETSNTELEQAYGLRKDVRVPPGPYVMLSVSDTGVGMDATVQAKIFEPFFTTKEPGKGTGLGLSTCYGIIKQAEGFIWAYSEVGLGTTFKVYLPRKAGPADQLPAPPRERTGSIVGTETILLVEDHDQMRALAVRTLQKYGYLVLEASGAAHALEICARHTQDIAMLLTDVVMPQTSGRALADEVRRRRPAIKVLFMSGYSSNVIEHHGVLDRGVSLLQKPFTPEQLGRAVRTVLDAVET